MMIHTEMPSIFSLNPRFPFVKFTYSRYRESFKIPNKELILIEIPKFRFKNGSYSNTVNPYAPWSVLSKIKWSRVSMDSR